MPERNHDYFVQFFNRCSRWAPLNRCWQWGRIRSDAEQEGGGMGITCSERGMRILRRRGAVGGADGAGWHSSDLLVPGSGAEAVSGSCLPQRLLGVVQHGGGADRGHHLRAGLIPTWRSGERCSVPNPGTPPPPRLAADPGRGCFSAAGFLTRTQRKEEARRPPVSLNHGQWGEPGRGRTPRRAGGSSGGGRRRRGWRGGEPLAHGDSGRHGGGSEPAERRGKETDRRCPVKGAGAAQGRRPPCRCGAAFHAQARTAWCICRAYMYSFPCTYVPACMCQHGSTYMSSLFILFSLMKWR